MTTGDPMYEEEPCVWCDGAGCDACNDTGMMYTERAIRLQVEAAEKAEWRRV